MQYFKRYSLSLILIPILINYSCAASLKPYDIKTNTMIKHYSKRQFHNAYIEASKLVYDESKNNNQFGKDFYLALLERGKIALANGSYQKAINDLQQAEKRFLLIENTISINEEIGAFFSNDLSKEYMTDPFETISISPYLIAAYLGKGDFNGARVERNRTINKINEYVESSNKTHLDNLFARFISALIYEMEYKYSDAIIEYNKIVKKKPNLSYIKNYIKNTKQNKTQLVILIDSGLAPYKYESTFGPIYINIDGKSILLRFAYPKMAKSYSSIDKFSVYDVSNNLFLGSTDILYDLENSILTHFQKTEDKRINRIKNKVIASIALSIGGQVAGDAIGGTAGEVVGFLSFLVASSGAFMDKADLRQWKTLPKNIQFIRTKNISTSTKTILIKYNSGEQLVNVNIKPNKLNFLYISIPE